MFIESSPPWDAGHGAGPNIVTRHGSNCHVTVMYGTDAAAPRAPGGRLVHRPFPARQEPGTHRRHKGISHEGVSRMKRFVRAPLLGMALLTFAAFAHDPGARAQDMRLIGSGASFPAPIYAAWFKTFSKEANG